MSLFVPFEVLGGGPDLEIIPNFGCPGLGVVPDEASGLFRLEAARLNRCRATLEDARAALMQEGAVSIFPGGP